VDAVPKLLRTKPLSRSNGGQRSVAREVALTVGFIRESVGVQDEIEVSVNCERPEMDAVIRGCLEEREGLVPAARSSGPPCGPATVVNRLGAARLDPALAVVSGELR
jgi:hypothetical protein